MSAYLYAVSDAGFDVALARALPVLEDLALLARALQMDRLVPLTDVLV